MGGTENFEETIFYWVAEILHGVTLTIQTRAMTIIAIFLNWDSLHAKLTSHCKA